MAGRARATVDEQADVPVVEEEQLERETGSEKAGRCPYCGKEVPAVTTPYGSVVRGACGCQGEEDVLEAQVAAANAGGNGEGGEGTPEGPNPDGEG